MNLQKNMQWSINSTYLLEKGLGERDEKEESLCGDGLLVTALP